MHQTVFRISNLDGQAQLRALQDWLGQQSQLRLITLDPEQRRLTLQHHCTTEELHDQLLSLRIGKVTIVATSIVS